jgi:Mn2+/Fe2+ NRAMP family transporter
MGRRTRFARIGASRRELRDAKWDVFLGMVLSNVVMYFIILATASTVHGTATRIHSATDAAQALRPVAGNAAASLWAVAIAGAGILAVPILTGSAAFALGGAFGWKCGLGERPGDAKAFYAAIVASTVAGMAINFAGINPIDALVWTAVINGFLAPPLLVVLMLVANNASVLGDHVNGTLANVIGWATTTIMFGAALALVFAAS